MVKKKDTFSNLFVSFRYFIYKKRTQMRFFDSIYFSTIKKTTPSIHSPFIG